MKLREYVKLVSPETFEDDIEDFLIDRRRVALTLIGEYA